MFAKGKGDEKYESNHAFMYALAKNRIRTILERMPAPYKTAAIANWFLDRAERDGVSLDPMKLQKLIYFAHGWYLALAGKPLINEHPQAWEYGPVIPSIYHEFKNFGRGPIKDRATTLKWVAGETEDEFDVQFEAPTIDANAEVEKLLEQIWKVTETAPLCSYRT